MSASCRGGARRLRFSRRLRAGWTVGVWLALPLALVQCRVGEPPERVVVSAEVPIAPRHSACGREAVAVRRGGLAFCMDAWTVPGFGQTPALVDFASAEAGCRDRGWRLCTEREWELACRGPAGWRYPYGPAYEPGRCVTERHAPRRAGEWVDCRSYEGIYDLSGNVAEWVEGGVLRGGDARGEGVDVRCAARARSGPGRPEFTGFRCCLPLSEETP